MKIAYLMQAGVPDMRSQPLSGPASHVWHVFHGLTALGHELSLLAVLDGQIWRSSDLGNFEPVYGWLDRQLPRIFERLIRRIQYELQLPYAALFESLRFAMACREAFTDYDLFYERMGWMGYGGIVAASLMNKPLVLEVNGDHLDELESLGIAPSGLQRSLSLAIMRQLARRTPCIVATGEGWRRRFIERWTVEPEKVMVVENGSEIVELLNRDELKSFRVPREMRRTLTVAYVGAFEPWHGVDILLAAVAKAVAEGASFRVILAGTGSMYTKIIQLIDELGMHEYVEFTGHVELQQLARYLLAADIGVAPYCGRVEYSGLKLLDYKAAGLAIVASGEDGQPAVLEHGKTGWVVPPCDVTALSNALSRLESDDDLRRRLGRAARVEAENYHGWEHTVSQLDQLLVRVKAT